METVIEFLDTLAARGVKLSSVEGQLKCFAPKGLLTADIKEGIARYRSELVALLDGVKGKQQTQMAERPPRAPKEFPLSTGQKGLYVLQSLNPDIGAYNVPICWKINSPVDTGMLAEAWGGVLEQFPILTARLIEKEGTLYQRLEDGSKTTIQTRNVAFADDEQFLSFLRAQARRPFDLNRGPLTRIDLFVRDQEAQVLLLTVHHIIFDGASAMIVARSLLAFYQQLREGNPVRLTHGPHGYQEFVAWEETMLASAEGASHARYWRRQLEGELANIELLPDFPRPASASFEGETLVDELPDDLSQCIRDCAKTYSLPPSVIFLGVFQLLLHRCTDQDDIIVGMPVLGRAAQQFAEEVGYFINMVPIRARCDDRTAMIQFLRTLRGTMLDALYHSSYPFPLMLGQVQSRGREMNPIFQMSFAYQNFATPADAASLLQQQALQIEPVAGILQEGEFSLGLDLFEAGASSFIVHVKYNPDLYAQRTARSVAERYRSLLREVSENPNLLLHEYRILADHEEERLLHEFNDTHAEYPKGRCLHELFIDQIESHADKTAVVCGEERLTYRQLYERSQDLALYLQSEGVRPDSLVGVCMERSLEMVVALFGILEAGGAYVPLDPDYPDERLDHMVRDSRVAIVLTQEMLREKLAALVA
ncbi:MAG TPA: condensation domain-containing protein, partial [Thermoanaerobaculia bacterium]|nr:condensation domain-containing protein [Thermoanaerobaculia bacterium]